MPARREAGILGGGSVKILAPFGFYGSGNTGDEATLMGFVELVRASSHRLDIAVASANPGHTAAVEPYFRYHKYKGGFVGVRSKLTAHRARALVFPGGTPIQDSLGPWPLNVLAPMIEYGDKWGKPAVFVGIGVESLTRPESQAIMRQRIVPLAAYWTVRSATDRQRLLDHGVRTDRVTVAADMAWLIPSADLAFGRDVLRPHLGAGRPLIAVNVNAETAVLERAPAMLASLAHALDSLIERHGVRVIFLFNEIRKGPTYDVAAANKVKSLMRRADAAFAVPEIYFSPAQTMSILGNCALAISTRYHVCIFAALQGVPFMALKRSDKIYDLCSDLAWNYGAAVEAVTGAEIANQADILLSSPEPVLRHLAARVQAMKARARNNLKGLDELRSVAGQVKPGAGLLRALNSTLSVGSRPG